MKRFLGVAVALFGSALAHGQADRPQPVRVVLPDQFERQQDSARFRGDVVVMLYGDRQGMPANKELGQRLHVQFHPAARGLPAGRASNAPVVPLEGLQPGQKSPGVHVVPVAVIGEVPNLVQNIVRNQVLKGSPEVPVWLDFGDTMSRTFGMEAGQPNLVVLDAWGRLRFRSSGALDEKTYARLVQVVDFLRKEAAGLSGK